MRKHWIERLFAVFTLFALSGALFPVLREAAGVAVDPVRGDGLMQALYLAIDGVIVTILLVRRRRLGHVIANAPLLWTLVALAFISLTWTGAPAVTLRSAVALLGTTLVGVYLASTFTLGELLTLCWTALTCALAASLLLVLFAPQLGVEHIVHEGAWRGVFVTKNSFARAMVLEAVLGLLIWKANGRFHRSGLLTLILAFAAVVGAQSATGIAVGCALLSLWPAYKGLRGRTSRAARLWVPFVLGVSMLSLWLQNSIGAVATALGRSATLTGRTELWRMSVNMLSAQPFRGYGYGAFWLGKQGPSAEIWRKAGWAVPHSHNGFLDLSLELGVLGLVIFVWLFIRTVQRARVAARSGAAGALLPIYFVTFFALYNCTESLLVSKNTLLWAMFAACALGAPKNRPSDRLAPAPVPRIEQECPA